MSWNLNDSLDMEKAEKMERSLLVKGESEGSRKAHVRRIFQLLHHFCRVSFPQKESQFPE